MDCDVCTRRRHVSTASAYEWQCGRHYVERSGYIGRIIGAITYNRTRDNHKEGNPKSGEVVLSVVKELMPGSPSPGFRMRNGKLHYRGKACVEYKRKEVKLAQTTDFYGPTGGYDGRAGSDFRGRLSRMNIFGRPSPSAIMPAPSRRSHDELSRFDEASCAL
jgi:hypothetical protein